MKKILIQSVILFSLFFCFFSAEIQVFAQGAPASPAAPAAPAGGGGTPPAGAPLPQMVPGAQPGAGAPAAPQQSSFFGQGALEWVVKQIAIAILSFFAWFMGVMGLLLNYAISFLVVGMGDMIIDYGFGAPIQTLWTILRNLVNIAFVFALIFIGISTILKSEASQAKRLLASVIISALLVNFSLFFAKAIIDVSNFTATIIYRQLVGSSINNNTVYQSGISGAFAERLGVSGVLTGGGQSTQTILEQTLSQGGISFIIVYGLGGSILFFMLAFAFGLGAFLLIVRFIMLIILMIFSPIAFLPSAFPGGEEYSKQWWSTLISQAFLAPVYLFGIYLTYYIVSSAIPNSITTQNLTQMFDPSKAASSMSLFLYYALAVALLIGTASMAKKMSNSGAAGSLKISNHLGKAVGLGLTGGAILGQRTAGRFMSHPAVQKRLDDLRTVQADKSRFALTRGLARMGSAAIKKGQEGTYDVRNSTLLGAAVGAAAGVSGVNIDIGKGSKTNYDKWMKEKKEDFAEYSRSLNVKNTPEIKGLKDEIEHLNHELHEDNVLIYEKDNKTISYISGGLEAALKKARKENNETEIKRVKNIMDGINDEIRDKRKVVAKLETANQEQYKKIVETSRLYSVLYTQQERGGITKAIKEDIEKNQKSTQKGEEYKPKAREKGGGGGGGDKKEASNDNHGGGDHGHAAH